MKFKLIPILGLLMTIAVLFVVGEPFLQNVSENFQASEDNFSNHVRANMSTGVHYQNLTVEGDIVVENGTYVIENMELHLAGKITARNNATVMIKNAKLVVTTRGEVIYRDAVVLSDRSKFIAENATIVLKSMNIIEASYITAGDEALVNITDSRLYGIAFIIGRQNSKTYVNDSSLKGPSPIDLEVFGVLTQDNSTARIQNSELDTAQARDLSSVYIFSSIMQTRGVFAIGNGVIEIKNSIVGTSQLEDNSTLLIVNSTVDRIVFEGLVLHIRDSRIGDVWASSNSTVRLINVSAFRVEAQGNSTVWLINSSAKEIYTRDQGKVYVGWQLPLFGTIAVPHTWLPVLQGLIFLAAVSLTIALLLLLNRRWKRWQLKKVRKEAESANPVSLAYLQIPSIGLAS